MRMFEFVGRPKPKSPEEVKKYLERVEEPRVYGSISDGSGTTYFEADPPWPDISAIGARSRYYKTPNYYRITETIKGSKNGLRDGWDNEVTRLDDEEEGVRLYRVRIGMARTGMIAFGLNLLLPDRYQVIDINGEPKSPLDVTAEEIYGFLNGQPVDAAASSEWKATVNRIKPKIDSETAKIADYYGGDEFLAALKKGMRELAEKPEQD